MKLYGRLGLSPFRIASVSQRAMELHSYHSSFLPVPKNNKLGSEMRNTANFHPEWGYLARRQVSSARRVSFLSPPLSARQWALVWFSLRSVIRLPSPRWRHVRWSGLSRRYRRAPNTSAEQGNAPSLTEKRSLTVNSRSADGATKEASASSTTRPPDGITALAEAPAATEGPLHSHDSCAPYSR